MSSPSKKLKNSAKKTDSSRKKTSSTSRQTGSLALSDLHLRREHLEQEKEHLEGKDIQAEREDELSGYCRLLERETQLLRQQYESLLREIDLVRRTPEGAMVRDYRRAKREKIDPIAIALKELERQEEMLREIHQFVKKFRDKKMTSEDFLKGRTRSRTASEGAAINPFLSWLLERC